MVLVRTAIVIVAVIIIMVLILVINVGRFAQVNNMGMYVCHSRQPCAYGKLSDVYELSQQIFSILWGPTERWVEGSPPPSTTKNGTANKGGGNVEQSLYININFVVINPMKRATVTVGTTK